MQYGQLTFIGDPVGYFIGNIDEKNKQNSYNFRDNHIKMHKANNHKTLWDNFLKRTLNMLG